MKELKAKREADEKRVTDELAKKAKAAKDAAVDVVEEYKDHEIVEALEKDYKEKARKVKAGFLKKPLFWVVFVGIILFGVFSSSANADVRIISQTPVYVTENVYETVEVCTKGDDKTTEGAIVGGIIGSQDGNAGLGAIIGAIIGDAIGEETCTTEKRIQGTTQVLTGYNVMMNVDGKVITYFIPV